MRKKEQVTYVMYRYVPAVTRSHTHSFEVQLPIGHTGFHPYLPQAWGRIGVDNRVRLSDYLEIWSMLALKSPKVGIIGGQLIRLSDRYCGWTVSSKQQ